MPGPPDTVSSPTRPEERVVAVLAAQRVRRPAAGDPVVARAGEDASSNIGPPVIVSSPRAGLELGGQAARRRASAVPDASIWSSPADGLEPQQRRGDAVERWRARPRRRRRRSSGLATSRRAAGRRDHAELLEGWRSSAAASWSDRPRRRTPRCRRSRAARARTSAAEAVPASAQSATEHGERTRAGCAIHLRRATLLNLPHGGFSEAERATGSHPPSTGGRREEEAAVQDPADADPRHRRHAAGDQLHPRRAARARAGRAGPDPVQPDVPGSGARGQRRARRPPRARRSTATSRRSSSTATPSPRKVFATEIPMFANGDELSALLEEQEGHDRGRADQPEPRLPGEPDPRLRPGPAADRPVRLLRAPLGRRR